MTAPEFTTRREGDWWVIDVPGYGVTQADTEADCPRMAADLVEQVRAAKIARFEQAPDADESLRSRLAFVAQEYGLDVLAYDLADAAIAVMRGDG